MEKRLLLFIVFAFLFLTAYSSLLNLWFPPPPRPVAKQVEKDGKAAKKLEPPAVHPAEKGPKAADSNGEPAGVEPAPVQPAEDDTSENPEIDPQPDEAPVAAKAVGAKEPELALYTLGSVDPASPYRMLVTFTNRGAAIERLELSSDRFSDLDDRSGYLGHLAAVNAPDGGALVRVVGAGTPADRAGMKAGDVIAAVEGRAIANAEDLHRQLATTKPGQAVALTVTNAQNKQRVLSALLTRRPLEVMRPECENILSRKETVPDKFSDPPSMLLTMEQVGDRSLDGAEGELKGVRLRDANWEMIDQKPTSIAFRRTLPKESLEIVKRYELAQAPAEEAQNESYPAYHLVFTVEIQNTGQKKQQVAFRLDGPTGLPTECWWYGSKISRTWGTAGMRDVIGCWEGNPTPVLFSASRIAKDEAESVLDRSLMYVGVDALYFAAMLLPDKPDLAQLWFKEMKPVRLSPPPDAKSNVMLTNVTPRLTSTVETLDKGQTLSRQLRLFAGPKKPGLLAQYHQELDPTYNLGELVYYGYPMWAGVARVMLGILHFLYSIVGNYGIAIVMLTVLVRGAMFPLSRKQALNMVKMQELQPEVKKIQEKYKDLQKRHEAQQELFRKHNYNPMGGCLLVFLQLPVFLGLYRSLMVDIELRQAPLFGHVIRWCSNLAAPDMFYDWSWIMPAFINSGIGMFALGPYFNVLPLFTIALFIVQQKMFMPPAMDEQQRMQQAMMKYMMIFMGIMFYKVPSGLCLYFIASSLWGLGERKLLPKPAPKPGEAEAKPTPELVRVGSNGSARGDKRKSKQRKR